MKNHLHFIAIPTLAITVIGAFNIGDLRTEMFSWLMGDQREETVSIQETETVLPANWISIPSLQTVEAPIIFVQEADEEVFQNALAGGVVHFPGTAKIGEYGNAYIFGHASDFLWVKGDYKRVFEPLYDIDIGAEILVTNESGQVFSYTVMETLVIEPTDFHVLDQSNNEKRLLTLQTSYPRNSAAQRFIVRAELFEESD